MDKGRNWTWGEGWCLQLRYGNTTPVPYSCAKIVRLLSIIMPFLHLLSSKELPNLPKMLTLFFKGTWGCPRGYKMFLGKCYKFFQTRMSWVQSHLFCTRQGRNGHIAAPRFFAEVIRFSTKFFYPFYQISEMHSSWPVRVAAFSWTVFFPQEV